MALSHSSDVGGYEYQFVTTPADWLVCSICHYPSREPYLSGCCGHTFCKSCLESTKKATTPSDVCPICQNKEFITMPNKQASRAVMSLRVFCTNKEKGCEWQGEINDIINHLGNSVGCRFEEVQCANDCGKCLQRQYLTNHVENECVHRKFNCQYCHLAGEHHHIEGKHKEHCPKLPIACPNKCEVGSAPRDSIEEHMKVCPLELIQCEYHVVGCEERMARKDQMKHNKEKMEEHLSYAVSSLNTTRQQLAATCQNLSKAEKQYTELSASTSSSLAKLETEFKTKLVEIESNTHQRITELEIHTKLLLGDWSKFINTIGRKLSSGDQVVPVIIRISEYTKKKREKIYWYSDSFHTHFKGYKMCLRVLAAGALASQSGTHLSVEVFLMKSPYDDQLSWPLKGHCVVKLLNQISNSEHHSGNMKNNNVADTRVVSGQRSHYPMLLNHEFISNEHLQKITPTCQYLKDDSIFLQLDYKLC